MPEHVRMKRYVALTACLAPNEMRQVFTAESYSSVDRVRCFWTQTTVKSALSPCPRRRITYIRMCSDINCYSGNGNGGISHCHFRNNN